LCPSLYEQHTLGGLLLNANRVDNYLGFSNGISGAEMVKIFTRHVQKYDVNTHFQKVILLDYLEDSDCFMIQSEDDKSFYDFVVVASGTAPSSDDLFLSARRKYPGRVFFNVIPLIGIGDQSICIVGAGDMAFDFALQLGKKNRVTILNRSDRIRALKPLTEEVFRQKKIIYRPGVSVRGIGAGEDGKLILEITDSRKSEKMTVDYLVAATGRVPERGFFSDALKVREEDLIQRKKLYFAGDVKNGIFRQAAIAIGDGLRAAMEIYDTMMEK
jgi:thioredoxin reductase (NADPH)